MTVLVLRELVNDVVEELVGLLLEETELELEEIELEDDELVNEELDDDWLDVIVVVVSPRTVYASNWPTLEFPKDDSKTYPSVIDGGPQLQNCVG